MKTPLAETKPRRIHAMHHNTVFHAVLKHVPWRALDRLVDECAANKKVRRLTTQDQFKALLYAQLAGSGNAAMAGRGWPWQQASETTRGPP
jgi:hypothetical protein